MKVIRNRKPDLNKQGIFVGHGLCLAVIRLGKESMLLPAKNELLKYTEYSVVS